MALGLRTFSLPPEFVWTASKLDAYQTCPYRFAWRHLAGEEPLPYDPVWQASFGTAVHAALEWLYLQPAWPPVHDVMLRFRKVFFDTSEVFRSRRRVADAARWAAEKGFAPCLQCAGAGCGTCGGLGRSVPVSMLLGYGGADHARAAYVEGCRMIAAYHAANAAARLPHVLHWTEQRFTYSFRGKPFRGVIDRIDRDDVSGAMLLVDYKTGRKSASPEENERDLQLWCYQTSVCAGEAGSAEDMDLGRLPWLHVGIYNVEHREFAPVRCSEPRWQRNAARVEKIIVSAEAGNFLPKSSGICRFCAVPECPERSG